MARYCDICDGMENIATMAIDHKLSCPHHPDAIAQQQSAPVASLGARRFYAANHPSGLEPRTALEAALEWIDNPETGKVQHIIVLVGSDSPEHRGASGTRFFQAGEYRHHGQMGLCLEGMHMIRDS